MSPNSPSLISTSISRRRLLIAAGLACAGLPVAAEDRAARLQRLLARERTVWLVRGAEQVRVTYWSQERGYNHDEYLNACWVLRDLRADRVFPMDRGLLDVMAGLQAWLAGNGIVAPLQIHSGYRTGRTNRVIEGAALDSRHVLGKAVDISVRGVSNVRLAGMASVLSGGGTGLYPGRSFVHVDTGDERLWIGRGRGSSR